MLVRCVSGLKDMIADGFTTACENAKAVVEKLSLASNDSMIPPCSACLCRHGTDD